MAENTKIEWTDHTMNPWLGCTRVAPGCQNCYAEAFMDKRLHRVKWGANGTRVKTSEANWRAPLKWNRQAEAEGVRRRVFCASHADVFEDWQGAILDSKGNELWHEPAPDAKGRTRAVTMADLRNDLFELIDQTPHLDWLLVTKRPENIRKMWPALNHSDPNLVESRVPVVGFPGYEVSNLGVVYSLARSSVCCNCGGASNAEVGLARKKYCSAACRQAAHSRAKSGGPRDLYPPTSMPLSPSVSKSGHCTVHLARGGRKHPILVHRLVLATFDRPAEPNEECRHLDGNARNNRIDNLQWGTQSENWDDSKLHRTHRRYSKLTEDQVDAIRVAHQNGDTYSSLAIQHGVSATQISNICSGRQWQDQPMAYRKNCWLLTSISDQETAERNIPELLKCRDLCPVLGISAEPLLDHVQLDVVNVGDISSIDCLAGHRSYAGFGGAAGRSHRHASLDWVIIGGESGPGARPFYVEHGESLLRQCRDAGVPAFMKQIGAMPVTSNANLRDFPPHVQELDDFGDGGAASCRYKLRHAKGGDPAEWPEHVRVRQFPTT